MYRFSVLLPVLLFLIAVIHPSVYAQSTGAAKAEARFAAGEYMKAAELYRKNIKKIKNKDLRTKAIFNLAECYRKTNQPGRAEGQYKLAVNRKYEDPIALLYLADAQMSQEKFDEALKNYTLYVEKRPDDTRGRNGIESCKQVQFWKDNAENWIISPLNGLNIARYNDFCAVYAGGTYDLIYFSSSRPDATGPDIHGATGQKFADIFTSRKIDDINWMPPALLGDPICTDAEEGSVSLSADLSTMYFTRCVKEEGKDRGCKIMVSKSGINNNWSVPEELPLGEEHEVFAHPAISPDNLTLYFTSDKEGGFGGTDIWKITRVSESSPWSVPENCGSGINTPGNEMFPSVRQDGTLYFASNGHPGFGGLDIFAAIPLGNGRYDIKNAGYPLNSNADDYSVCFQGMETKGLLTSSRGGSLASNVDNIYFFDLSAFNYTLYGVVKDELTGEVIPGAKIRGIGTDGRTMEVTTNSMGLFGFPLGPESDYIFLAIRDGYLNGRGSCSTKSIDFDADIELIIPMKSAVKPIEIKNVFYDFGKWDLKPEAMASLDELIIVLQDNPQIVIELGSHTDSRGSDADNMVLSEKRAQAVVDYLISKGIPEDRLVSKGYGESVPKIVTAEMRLQHPFMRVGVTLGELYIKTLSDESQIEAAHQLNRRTEFRVLRNDYVQDVQPVIPD